jgi:YD repeat-containing protein
MFNKSKAVSLALIAALGTFLWSCNDDESSTPNTPTCNLKTATTGLGADAELLNFTYNTQNQLTSIASPSINGNLIYQNNRVILSLPGVGIADTMLLQGGKWFSSYSSSEFEEDDSTVTKINTKITPTFTGNLVTQIKSVSIEETRVNGVLESTDKDSIITTLTYNDKGNVIRIAQPGRGSYEFSYSDTTANVKVNNYFNGSYFSEFLGEGISVPFLTGNLKLCIAPPSSVFNSQTPNEKEFFRGIKSDANKNLTEISLYEGISTNPFETYKFTYDCK